MPLYAKREKNDWAPAPEGLHSAICCDVVDLGELVTQWGEKWKIQISWFIDKINPKNNKPFLVSARYTNSLHEKSNLTKVLQTWRGKKFTEIELDGFDLEKLIGAPCMIQIMHNTKDNETYANVVNIIPAIKGGARAIPDSEYIRIKDRPGYIPPKIKEEPVATEANEPWEPEMEEELPF